MSRGNPSFSSTQLTGIVLGVPSASVTGALQGVIHSGQKSAEVLERSSGADDILKSVQEAIKAYDKEEQVELPGLDIVQGSLGESFPTVQATGEGVATTTMKIATGVGTTLSHGTQLLSDTGIASSAIVAFSDKHVDIDSIRFQASTLGDAEANFFANCKNLFETLDSKIDGLEKHLPHGHHFAESHESVAHSTASPSMTASVSVVAILSAGFDLVGSALREIQASASDTSKHSAQEKAVYDALTACITAFGQTKKSDESALASLKNLNALIEELANFNRLSELMGKDSATGSRIPTKLASLASIPVTLCLKSIVLSALTVMHSHAALDKEESLSGETKRSASQASKLEEDQTHSLNVSELLAGCARVNVALQEEVDKIQSESDGSIIGIAATGSHVTSAVVSLVPSLITGLTGIVIREVHAASKFLSESKGSGDKSKEVLESKSDVTGERLDELLREASKLKDALEMAEKFGVALPASTGVSRATISASAVGTLNTLLGLASGVTGFRSLIGSLSKKPLLCVLEEKEKKEKMDSLVAVKEFNKDKSQLVSTDSAPKDGLSLESALDAVISTLILTDRSSHPISAEKDERKHLNSTGKALVDLEHGTLGSVTINTSGFLTGALGVTALLALETGVTTEALTRSFVNALQIATNASGKIKSITAGPDEHKVLGSASNFSSVSNGLRLMVDETKKCESTIPGLSGTTASTLLTSVWGSELLASRSLMVALTNSKVLFAAIRALSQAGHPFREEKSQSTVTKTHGETMASADEEVICGLAEAIVKVLGDPDNFAGLNHDMASQLQSVSQASIVTALTTNSAVILPLVTAAKALTAGSEKAEDKQLKDKAVSQSSISKQVSEGLNTIQAFTLGCGEHLVKAAEDGSGGKFSLVGTAALTGQSSAVTGLFTAGLSLLIEELLESALSRGLTLVKSDVVTLMTKDTSGVAKEELSDNLSASTQEVKHDSHSGQTKSMSHSISAMRSTLSRLSEALKECAGEVRVAIEAHFADKILVEGELHSIQASMLHSMASALTAAASIVSRLSETTGGVFLSSILSRGKVDELKGTVLSLDQRSKFSQVATSGESVAIDDSASYLSTALATDIVSGTVFNLIITLFKASLLGSQVMLSVAKVLEIVLSHEDPEAELSLETQALSTPQVGSCAPTKTIGQMLTALLAMPVVSLGGATAASMGDPCMDSTLKSSFASLQQQVDGMIDSVQILDDQDQDQDQDEKKSKKNPTINLKTYFAEILKSLGVKDDNVEDLVNRFNRGGMNLSKYHSAHGGIPKKSDLKDSKGKKKEPEAPFIVLVDAFAGEFNNESLPPSLRQTDDAAAVLDKFIDTIFSNRMAKGIELDTFITHIKELKGTLSPKATAVHKYVISRIASKLYTAKHISTSTLFSEPRQAFDREGFIAIYTNLSNEKLRTQSTSLASTSTMPSVSVLESSGSGLNEESKSESPPAVPAKSATATQSEVELTPLSHLFSNIDARRKAREARRKTPTAIVPLEVDSGKSP